MRNKILKTILVSILIMTLALVDFIILGQNIAIAIAEELETQNLTTNVKNVEFNAYFREEETKVHSKQALTTQGESLILDITVKEAGVLEEGKIKIENANFKIDQENVDNKIIKSIDAEANEIELNQITSGTQTIMIPIKFEKQGAKTSNYFDQENQIILTGKYRQSDINIKDVEGRITTRLMWTEDANINLKQDVEKYIDLGEQGILLQQKIALEVTNNALPIERQTVKIAIPELEEQMPSKIVILYNGNKLDESKYQMDLTNQTIEIAQQQDSNNIQWGIGVEEYKIIYTYDKEIGYAPRNINMNTTITTKLYTKEEETKTETEQQQIDQKGNIVTLNKIVTPSVYRGYMYANVSNEVTYRERLNLEFSNIELLEDAITLTGSRNFVDSQNIQYGINNSITYQMIQISKSNMLAILGEDGNIQIQNQDGEVIENITKETQADESGNIVYPINDPIYDLKIVISKPEKEGNLDIYIAKAISGQTTYSKDTLKLFTALEDRTQMTNNLEQITASKNVELKDTVTEAEMQVNNSNWSTITSNQNVKISVTLVSNQEKYDLYKNPYIEIQLPSMVENIRVNSINKLYADELQIKSALLDRENKTIKIQLAGEQTNFVDNINKGIQLVIDANIDIQKDTPTQTTELALKYKNENRENEENQTNLPIQLNSKYGVLLYSSMEGYNGNSKIETISNDVTVGKLNSGEEAKQVETKSTLINNYEDAITQVSMIGRIPEIGQENVNGKQFNNTFLAVLKGIKTNGSDSRVYYSTQNEENPNWTEEVEDISSVKMFKIETDQIEAGDTLSILATLQIPEQLEKNESVYPIIEVNYVHNGQEEEKKTILGLETSKEELQQNSSVNREVEGLDISVVSVSGGQELTDKQEIYEGQTVKNTIQITNNTNSEIQNISLVATQNDKNGNNNVTYYNYVTTRVPTAIDDVWMDSTKYQEDNTLEQKEWKIDKLEAGETKTLEYEFSVHEMKNQGETTKGNIKVTADNREEQNIDIMTNTIKEAKLKLNMWYGYGEENELMPETYVPFDLEVKNISNQDLTELDVTIPLVKGIKITEDYNSDVEDYSVESYDDNMVKMKLHSIKSGETKKLCIFAYIEEVEANQSKNTIDLSYEIQIGNETYRSNHVIKEIEQSKAKLEIEQKSNVQGDEVRDQDNIIYTTTIRNSSVFDKTFTIYDILPAGLNVNEAYLQTSDERLEMETLEDNTVSIEYHLKAGEEITVVIDTILIAGETPEMQLINYLAVRGENQYDISNTLTYDIWVEGNYGEEEDPDNPDEPDDNKTTGSVSGMAWLDENRNGEKDDNENGLSDIKVKLIKTDTGEIVKDKEGKSCEAMTTKEGNYSFTNVEKGNYIVVFEYDTNLYAITDYQKSGVSTNKNSDVISKQMNNTTVAVTDTIRLEDRKITNIDAGFTKNQIFDLRLDKYVSRITVQNKTGTKVMEYNDTQLAKIELKAKELVNTSIIIEYKIRVTNEGEIPGYVNEIVDYIPDDLKFNSEINKDWYTSTDGKLHNSSIQKEIIQVGETKEVTLTLIKTMDANNTGTIVNKAEIEKCSNDLSIEDKDSVPGNQKQGEDDMSTAEVIVSISTGMEIVIGISVVGIILVIIAIVIRKYQRKEE